MGLFSGLKTLNRRVKFETEAIPAVRYYCSINVEKLSLDEQMKLTDATIKSCDKMFPDVNEYEFTVIYMVMLAMRSADNPLVVTNLAHGCELYVKDKVRAIRKEVLDMGRMHFNF